MLFSLPLEVKLRIIANLGEKDQNNLRLVCKELKNEIIRQPQEKSEAEILKLLNKDKSFAEFIIKDPSIYASLSKDFIVTLCQKNTKIVNFMIMNRLNALEEISPRALGNFAQINEDAASIVFKNAILRVKLSEEALATIALKFASIMEDMFRLEKKKPFLTSGLLEKLGKESAKAGQMILQEPSLYRRIDNPHYFLYLIQFINLDLVAPIFKKMYLASNREKSDWIDRWNTIKNAHEHSNIYYQQEALRAVYNDDWDDKDTGFYFIQSAIIVDNSLTNALDKEQQAIQAFFQQAENKKEKELKNASDFLNEEDWWQDSTEDYASGADSADYSLEEDNSMSEEDEEERIGLNF